MGLVYVSLSGDASLLMLLNLLMVIVFFSSLYPVEPSEPKCKIIGKREYGQNINLTCNSDKGFPEPKYVWQSYDIQNQNRPLQGIVVGGIL